MSTRPPLTLAEADLAADFALGQLDSGAHANAIRLLREHPAFRAEVGRWTGMLTPMFEEVEPREPPAGLFDSIASRLDPRAANDDDALRTRLRRWQWFGGGASAIAAALALVLVTTQPPAPIAPTPPTATVSAPQPPMIATIASDGPGKMIAVWNGGERSLTVAAASPMPDAPGHAHELWLIPADGKPRSMGVMPQGDMHATVPDAMAAQFAEGATLAISVEPMGGSPSGQPTGPVIASGALHAAA
jgi:anti-sigma-K factor RskA